MSNRSTKCPGFFCDSFIGAEFQSAPGSGKRVYLYSKSGHGQESGFITTQTWFVHVYGLFLPLKVCRNLYCTPTVALISLNSLFVEWKHILTYHFRCRSFLVYSEINPEFSFDDMNESKHNWNTFENHILYSLH